jgi:hypothetical protein
VPMYIICLTGKRFGILPENMVQSYWNEFYKIFITHFMMIISTNIELTAPARTVFLVYKCRPHYQAQ